MFRVVFEIVVLLLGASVLASSLSVPNHEHDVGAIAKRQCQEFPIVSDGTNQVLGGVIAEDGYFPYMAALGRHENGNITFKCGASLISNEYLLTAAGCFRIDKLTIARFGVVKLFDYLPADPPVDIELNDPIYHPDRRNNDIALVQLKRSINNDEVFFINPICLYTEPEDPKPEMVLTIAGWGQTDPNTDKHNTLMKGPVRVLSQENCQKVVEEYKKRNSKLVDNLGNMICALKQHPNGSTEMDTCHGDAGGPLELVQNSRRYLVGITSKGVRCGSIGMPGLYTRVANYIDWIESIVWSDVKGSHT